MFYVNGQPRSAQGLLERLQLDADASMSAARGRVEYKPGEGAMFPELAQALFAMALLPLLRSGDEESGVRNPLDALSAYGRVSRD